MAILTRLASRSPATAPTAAEAVRATLADGVARLQANETLARAGDVEAVHQMRVAVRRLRSDLRTLKPLLDADWTDELSESLRPLAASLGAVRDLDVLVARLEARAADLSEDLGALIGGLHELRDMARGALVESLGSPPHAELVARVVSAARDPQLSPLAAFPAIEVVPPLVSAGWRRLARRGDRLATALAADPNVPDDADVHRVRILAKRARYAAEAAQRVLGPRRGRAAARFARRLAAAQQLLGEHQDVTGVLRELRDAVDAHPSDARLAFAAGRLFERELAVAAGCRAAFPGLWVELRRPRLRRWLDR
jgi:CHAD domain-containing protein